MAIIYGENTAVDYASGNLASFGKSYSRMGAAPLDMTEVWYDWESLLYYASFRGTNESGAKIYSYKGTDENGNLIYDTNNEGTNKVVDTSAVTSYVGQKVGYVNKSENKIYHYSIQLDGSLKEIGVTPLGDDKTINVNSEGVISILGSEQAEINTVPMMGENGIVWQPIVEEEALATRIQFRKILGYNEEVSYDITSEGPNGEAAVNHIQRTGSEQKINILPYTPWSSYALPVTLISGGVAQGNEFITQLSLPNTVNTVGGSAFDGCINLKTLKIMNPQIDIFSDAFTNCAIKNIYFAGNAEQWAIVANKLEGKIAPDAIINLNYTEDFTDIYDNIENKVITLSAYTDEELEGEDHSAFKHYVLSQGGTEIGHIDIPVDLVVTSGGVIVATEADKLLDDTVVVGETYIKLEIANQTKPLYIDVKKLANDYIAGETKTVKVTVANNVITADVKVSQKAGNTLSIDEENGGLYVHVPEVEIPPIEIGNASFNEPDEGTESINVVYEIEVDENDKHLIAPTLVEVATKEAITILRGEIADVDGVVRKKYIKNEETKQWAIENIESTIDETLVPATLTTENGTTYGYAGLITPIDKEKLDGLVLNDDGTVGASGKVEVGNVVGIDERIRGIVTGSAEGELDIQAGSRPNVIEQIALPDAVLTIIDKTATILSASNTNYGVVKGQQAVNKIMYDGAGVGEIHSLSTDKLVDGTLTFVINAGEITEPAT